MERQRHPHPHLHDLVVRHIHSHLTIWRSLPPFNEFDVLFQHRLIVFVEQGGETLVVDLVLHPNAHQIENTRIAVLHFAFNHQQQTDGTGLHQHPESLFGLEQIQFCALAFRDVVHHQHRLVGGGVGGTRGFEVNGPALLGDTLEFHPGACKLASPQSLPIPGVHQVQNVLPDGQFLPPKKDCKLLVGVDDLVPLEEGNALHGVSSQSPESLLAVANDLLVHHAFADVTNLEKEGSVPNWHSLPLGIEHRSRLTHNPAPHFGGIALQSTFHLGLEQPHFVALEVPQPPIHCPNLGNPRRFGRPVQHATRLRIPSHRFPSLDQNH